MFATQIVGGIAAAGIVSALFPNTMNVRTSLSKDTSVVRGLFIEMFLTAMLVFTVFMLAAEKHKSTFLAPIGIGLALFVAELSGLSPPCRFKRETHQLRRRLLHRRQSQPRPLLRSRRRPRQLRRLPLDLLARPGTGLHPRSHHVQTHQVAGIRNRQPGPGLRRERDAGLRPGRRPRARGRPPSAGLRRHIR